MKTKNVETMTRQLATKLEATYRESRRGVPHVVVNNPFRDGVDYSVCFFKNTSCWRIFKGYNDFAGEQKRVTVASQTDVELFFKQLPFEEVIVRKCGDESCEIYVRVPRRYCNRHVSIHTMFDR